MHLKGLSGNVGTSGKLCTIQETKTGAGQVFTSKLILSMFERPAGEVPDMNISSSAGPKIADKVRSVLCPDVYQKIRLVKLNPI